MYAFSIRKMIEQMGIVPISKSSKVRYFKPTQATKRTTNTSLITKSFGQQKGTVAGIIAINSNVPNSNSAKVYKKFMYSRLKIVKISIKVAGDRSFCKG